MWSSIRSIFNFSWSWMWSIKWRKNFNRLLIYYYKRLYKIFFWNKWCFLHQPWKLSQLSICYNLERLLLHGSIYIIKWSFILRRSFQLAIWLKIEVKPLWSMLWLRLRSRWWSWKSNICIVHSFNIWCSNSRNDHWFTYKWIKWLSDNSSDPMYSELLELRNPHLHSVVLSQTACFWLQCSLHWSQHWRLGHSICCCGRYN